MDGLLAASAAIALIALALGLRALRGTWTSPDAVNALYWAAAVALPLALAPDTFVSGAAAWWIALSALAFAAGTWLFPPLRIRMRQRVPTGVGAGLLAVVTVLGISSSIVNVYSSGYDLSWFLSPDLYLVMTAEITDARYAGTAVPSPVAQALLVFVYVAPALGGIFFARARSETERALSLTSLLPAVLIAAIETARLPTLFAAALWSGGLVAARTFEGRPWNLPKRSLLAVPGLPVLGALIFVASDLVRLGRLDPDLIPTSLERLQAWVFGYFTAFSQWFELAPEASQRLALGTYTFPSFLTAAGLEPRIPGLFESEFVTIADFTTNIFTIHRGLIEDFSMPGALLFQMAYGLVGAVIYRGIILGSEPAVPLLAFFYASILLGSLTSIFGYNSVFAAAFVAALLVAARPWISGERAS